MTTITLIEYLTLDACMVDGVAMSPEEIADYHRWAKEQSPHTSATVHVLQRGESTHSSNTKPLELATTPEEDEAWDRLQRLAGCVA